MLEQALECAEVVRETYILDGDHACLYRIRAKKSRIIAVPGVHVSFPEGILDNTLVEKISVEKMLTEEPLVKEPLAA